MVKVGSVNGRDIVSPFLHNFLCFVESYPYKAIGGAEDGAAGYLHLGFGIHARCACSCIPDCHSVAGFRGEGGPGSRGAVFPHTCCCPSSRAVRVGPRWWVVSIFRWNKRSHEGQSLLQTPSEVVDFVNVEGDGVVSHDDEVCLSDL